MLRVLSLGAGVQSTTVALMSAVGDLPRLDACVFADTQWEGRATYRHLDWLEAELERAGIPVHRVSAGSLRDDTHASMRGERADFPGIPFHATSPDGKGSMLKRQCTTRYKIKPIRAKIRELAGHNPAPGAVEQWFGISVDEYQRMRTSDVRYVTHRYPLVDLRMTREHCLQWLAVRGYPEPPKSACTVCPFHGNAGWRRLKHESPDEWQEAVAFDRAVRTGLPRVAGEAFLHFSRRPLEDVDLRTREERGELNLFDAECSGHCGV